MEDTVSIASIDSHDRARIAHHLNVPVGISSTRFIQNRVVQSVGYDHLIPEDEVVIEHLIHGVSYIVVRTGTPLVAGVKLFVKKLKESAKNEPDAIS